MFDFTFEANSSIKSSKSTSVDGSNSFIFTCSRSRWRCRICTFCSSTDGAGGKRLCCSAISITLAMEVTVGENLVFDVLILYFTRKIRGDRNSKLVFPFLGAAPTMIYRKQILDRNSAICCLSSTVKMLSSTKKRERKTHSARPVVTVLAESKRKQGELTCPKARYNGRINNYCYVYRNRKAIIINQRL